MTSSNITTNQFVRIDQTPASIAERVIARIIDMVIAGIIGFTAMYFYFELDYETRNQLNYLFFFLIILPLWLYDFLWETFNEGQSPGKYIMKIRVVNKDGSRPTMGSFFMRWLLSTYRCGIKRHRTPVYPAHQECAAPGRSGCWNNGYQAGEPG